MHNITTFAQRWSLILIGIMLAISGLIYGAIPHQTPYQSMPKSFIAHYLSGRGTGYMQLQGNPTLYIVNEGDFLPAFSADYLNHGQIVISFLYRTDETTSIDASSDTNVRLVGQAYTVEQIKLYQQFGQPPEVFSTHEYYENPNGYYQHNWMVGLALALLGLIFTGFGAFMIIRRGKKQRQIDFTNTPELEAVNKQPEHNDQDLKPEIASGNKDSLKL